MGGKNIIRNCEFKGVKDVKYHEADLNNLNTTVGIFEFRWVAHDFGYTCYMPQELVIDNFKAQGSMDNINVFHAKSYDVYFDGVLQKDQNGSNYKYKLSQDSFSPQYICPVTGETKANPNIYVPPKHISITNQTLALRLSNMRGLFDKVMDDGTMVVVDNDNMLNLHRKNPS